VTRAHTRQIGGVVDTLSSVASGQLRGCLHPLTGAESDYDELLDEIKDRRVVLIGEASHGTHEFYRERATLTKRLIERHGFTVVAIEGDWPDAYRVNRYVTGLGSDVDANQALEGFRRFPTWMWRNHEVYAFVDWLRDYNLSQSIHTQRTRFYGLDLYSLHTSMEAVVAYLERVDPDAAQRARERYSCFDHLGSDAQAYGYALAQGVIDPCEEEVIAQLVELQGSRELYLRGDGSVAEDELFAAEQNALLVHDAEEYYRLMYRAGVSSWNLRDHHMASTLDALVAFLEQRRTPIKVVVWAHNSHVGDARATAMASRGEVNIGQLARERYGDDAYCIGMSTFAGHVTAASDWGAPTERKRVRPARPGSFEATLHDLGVSDFWVRSRDLADTESFSLVRLERAIGVIYRPDTELQSHYFAADLTRQFDAVIHCDQTRALAPLEMTSRWS